MRKQRHTPEQIIRKLRKAEVELTKGQSAVEVACRSSNITYKCHSSPRLSSTRAPADFGAPNRAGREPVC